MKYYQAVGIFEVVIVCLYVCPSQNRLEPHVVSLKNWLLSLAFLHSDQHNTRWFSEMKCLYFITCEMFDRVESWLVLPCFRTVRHFSLMEMLEMLKQLLLRESSHYFLFFSCRNANFSLYLSLKWEMNDLVLCLILVAMYQSYAVLVWTDSSFLLSSMAVQNGVDYAAVILQTWLNFSVYLWVSTNTLCILLPCIECFYFPLI